MHEKVYIAFTPGKIVYDCSKCPNFCCHYGYIIMSKDSVINALKKIPEVYYFLEYKSNSNFYLDMGGNSCWFLDNGRCILHDENNLQLKPISCRLFPLRLIKGPDKYIIVNHEICPTVSISNQINNDKKILQIVKESIKSCKDLILDFGVVYGETSFFKGKEQSWEERFDFEGKYRDMDKNLREYIYSYTFDDVLIQKLWPFWSQLKTSPVFLETDLEYANQMFFIFKDYFDIYFKRVNNFIKAIHYAIKCTNNDILLKYRNLALKPTVMIFEDRNSYYMLTEKKRKIYIPKFLYDVLKMKQKLSLQRCSKKYNLEKNQLYVLLDKLTKSDGIAWEVVDYENNGSD